MASAPEVETVLVPIDGSDESVVAVEYALAIAARYDASVHALYVLGEEAARAIEAGEGEEEMAEEARSVLESVEPAAIEEGVELTHSVAVGFSTTRKLVHPGSVILDCAEEVDADFLVVPREPARTDAADVLEKAAEYVLLYASQPVLSV